MPSDSVSFVYDRKFDELQEKSLAKFGEYWKTYKPPYDLCIFNLATIKNSAYTYQLETYMSTIGNDTHSVTYYVFDDQTDKEPRVREFCDRHGVQDFCIFLEVKDKFDSSKFSLGKKSVIWYQWLVDNQMYDQCRWMLKSDPDAFIVTAQLRTFVSQFPKIDRRPYFAGRTMGKLQYAFTLGNIEYHHKAKTAAGNYLFNHVLVRAMAGYTSDIARVCSSFLSGTDEYIAAMCFYVTLGTRWITDVFNRFMIRAGKTGAAASHSLYLRNPQFTKGNGIKEKSRDCVFIWHKFPLEEYNTTWQYFQDKWTDEYLTEIRQQAGEGSYCMFPKKGVEDSPIYRVAVSRIRPSEGRFPHWKQQPTREEDNLGKDG